MADNMQDVSVKRTFVFNGKTYTMGRLVLAVIKDFAATHNGTNPEALRAAFPDSLLDEGTLHLVEDKVKITPNLEGRYFLKPAELIPVLGATIAVSNRWHRFNIYNFLPHARALGYDITELHDGVAVGEAKNTSKLAPKNGKAAPQKAAANKKESAPTKVSPETAKQAPPEHSSEKASIPPAAQSETTAAPRWKEGGDFANWYDESGMSSVVFQRAIQSVKEVILSFGNAPLTKTHLDNLARYIFTPANIFASYERKIYHLWLRESTSPRPKVPEDGEKDYTDFLRLREDKKLNKRAQNAALKKLGVYTTSTEVEPLSRDLLDIIVNLCMKECLTVVINVYNAYHMWVGKQTDFCLEYSPYKAYRTFLDDREKLDQVKNWVEQNIIKPARETDELSFLNQSQFEPIVSIAEIITLSYMDSIAKDYHNWLGDGAVAKKTPQKAAVPKSESTAKSPKELFEEAERLYHGRGVPQDTSEAYKFYMEAADTGHPDAAFVMAGYFERMEDYEAAADYYYDAARLGVSEAAEPLLDYGKKYEFGNDGFERDVIKAVNFYMEAADVGYTEAAAYAGNLLAAYGKYEDALPYLKKAAEAGYEDAMFNAGNVCFMLGDQASAIRYFKMADAEGDPGAADMLERLGESHMSSTEGSDAGFRLTDADGNEVSVVALDANGNVVGGNVEDKAQLEKMQASAAAQMATQGMTPKQLEKAAKGGNEYAMFQLGRLYWMGEGVKQNREKALEWLTAAEDHGCGDATYFLKSLVEKGELLLAGDNAAANGAAGGSYRVFDDKGKLYDVNVPPGTVPPISFIKGVATQYAARRKELDKGHQCLKNNDVVGAKKYWLKAAGKGDFAAMCNLGNLYQHYYSPPPMDRVWHWYQQAAAGGVKEAALFLQSMSGS